MNTYINIKCNFVLYTFFNNNKKKKILNYTGTLIMIQNNIIIIIIMIWSGITRIYLDFNNISIELFKKKKKQLMILYFTNNLQFILYIIFL